MYAGFVFPQTAPPYGSSASEVTGNKVLNRRVNEHTVCKPDKASDIHEVSRSPVHVRFGALVSIAILIVLVIAID